MKHPILNIAAVLLAASTALQAAVSTWVGTNSVFWTNALNWSPDIPGFGDDVVIADVTGNNLTLTDSRTIGNLQFGTAGTRTAGFQIRDNVASHTLTITNGFTANGALGTTEMFFVPIVIQNDQMWSVGGGAGSASADAGIRLRERAAGVPLAVTLNGTLTKIGSGQLSFVGRTVGDGNIIINQGSIKMNAGGTTLLTVNGTGSITVNSNASLIFSRNSGTFNITKAVVLNGGSTIQFGGNLSTTVYPFPISWNGNVSLSAAVANDGTEINILAGDWTGNASITTANANAAARQIFYVLSNNIAGLTGSINLAGNVVRIGFAPPTPGNAAIAWSLNHAGATLETYGATNVHLGSLSGGSGTLRNNDPAAQPAVVTVGALNTSTTCGAVIADNTGSLGLVKVGSGSLTLTGNSTFSGGTIISNGAVLLQGTVAAGGSGSVAVRAGASFGGSGTANGTISVDAGATIQANGGIGAPPLNVGTLTLGNTGTDATTAQVDVYFGGKIVCGGGLTVNGTNTINIAGGAPPAGVYDLITYTGPIGGNGFAGFKLGTLPPGVVASLQDSGSAIQLNVTATAEPSVWVGNALSQWNNAGGLEWKGAISGNPQAYLNLNPAFFDDSASSFAVNITENVTPAIASVSNSTAYTFSGAGGIAGTAALVKNGPGTLTLLTSNNYSGGTYITNGVLRVGNGGTDGSISGTVLNDASLVFERSDLVTFAGDISGNGSVEQHGLGSTTLGGANTFLGLASVSAGTLRAGSGTALGDIAGSTVVSNGATLDINTQNLGAEPITAQGTGVNGAGAIVNNGTGDSQNATRFVTLAGPTTFGGARRWDVRDTTNPLSSNPNGGGTGATLTGNGFPLTKISSNVVAFINAGDTGLGDIEIQGGTLTFSRSTFMGDPAKKIAVYPGATLQLHRTSEFLDNVLNKVLFMTNATLAVEGNGLTNNVFAGPVTLSGSNTISLPTTTGLNLQGSVSGDGSVTTVGTGTLIFSGNANFTGGTTIGGGTLEVDGTLGTGAHPLQIANGTILAGTGTIIETVTMASGSVLSPGITLAPGNAIGALTINSSLSLSAGCTNVFAIDKDLGTNDTVKVQTSLTYAGTLVVSNVGATAFAPGDSFKLFNAASYSGGFARLVPPTPGPGLIWLTNSLAVNGTLSVAVLPNPVPLLVLSASSLVSTNVNVFFSAQLDPNTAQNPANYTMSTSNQVQTATLITPTNVLLGLDSPITNTSYALRVQSVQDLAFIPNVVATTNVPGVAIDFLESASVLVTNGSAFAYGTNAQVKVYADGADIFGTLDQFQFVYKYVTGDFDLSVRLESLQITDPAAKAGIMARDVVDPTFVLFDDRHYLVAGFSPDPTRNNNFTQYREVSGGTVVAPGAPRPPATYPNNWLRLKRTGSILQGYSGPNGLNWTPMTAVDSSTNAAGPYPATIRVGLAVTSHNVAQTTEAVFSNFGTASIAPDLVLLNAVLSGSDLVLSWPTNTGATLQAAPVLNPPVTWTNVPGSDTTNLIQFPIGSANSFFRLVR